MAFARTIMGGGTSAGQAIAILGGGVQGLVTVGTSATDALALPPMSAIQITTSSASTGGILPAAVPGSMTVIANNSGQSILIYPPTGAQIDALTVTTQGFTLTNGQKALFICASTTKWIAILSA
jgi:hypothetical protein